MKHRAKVVVRNTQPGDFDRICEISRAVYRGVEPWGTDQLASHLKVFPEGQLVAVEQQTNRVLGMAASLIVKWDEYDHNEAWRDFTDHGYFTNHDPEHGRTLYGAEIMVDPASQGMGVGKAIYKARRELCRSLMLRRIRAGARLRGYGQYADSMSPEEYVLAVVNRQIGDPTLTFQIKQGFRVIDVVRDYLSHDPESRGHAALIEWINHEVAQPADYRKRDPKFGRKRKPKE
jgi:GNAT superfamily N-acetyltransferase